MMTIENKRRLVIIGMFLAPVAVVKFTGWFYGIGAPADASAAVEVNPVVDVPMAAAVSDVITDQQRGAALKIAALYKQPFGETPFYYDAREISIEPDGPIQIDPSAPTVIVQAILASAAGDTALISGKMYKVGDEFEKSGWFITVIDNKARAVTLKNPKTEREVTASVRISE